MKLWDISSLKNLQVSLQDGSLIRDLEQRKAEDDLLGVFYSASGSSTLLPVVT